MTKFIKKPLSVLLAALMIVSLFTVVPITASAAEETSTVTWNSFPGNGGMSSGGVTLTTTQGNTRMSNCFYPGRGSATFTAPEGSVFTKIELKNCDYVSSLNFPGATVAESGGYWEQKPWDDEPEWVSYYTVTWTGESSEVTFSGDFVGIKSIVFTLKSVAPTTYTVTWKNGDTVLETDTNVEKDATPSFGGETPAKTADDSKHYTFSGWSDGTTTYGLNDTLPAVSADVTYTAQFTATEKAPATVKTIAAGETYYIGDSIAFSDAPPFVYVRYDDDISYGPTGAYTYLIGGENTTITAPTYSTRDGQWKFNDVLRLDPWASARPLRITGTNERTPIGFKCSGGTGTSSDPFTFECVFEAEEETVINYDGEHTLNPSDKVTVSGEDKGKENFGLDLDEYFNMQILGIQLKKSIETAGGEDGIRFVTAVNTNLLKGEKIEDYGYIVVKAKEGTSVADIYSKMDNLTYDKVANSPKNIFSCYGSDNTISGDFGKFDTDTDYKYVTLSLTGTQGSTDTVAARFYVKTTDGKYYYADYVKGNDTFGGMAFNLADVA